MNISAPFIRRPIAIGLLMTGLALLGLVAYGLLPIAALPQIDFPTIQINANLPGASAEIMATSVAAPLERQLSAISGVSELASTNSPGSTLITVQFGLDHDINVATQDVQAAINAAAGTLPKDLPNPPRYRKVNPADFTILSLAVTSDTLPISKVDDYADNYVAQQLSRISGVGLVDLNGEQKPAVRVQINPAAIASLGISLEEIRQVLARSTPNAPKGTLDGPRRSVMVDTTDQLLKADAYRSLVVAYRNGAPVRIADIGTAIDSVEDVNRAAWVQGKPTVIVDVHKEPGFNVVDTVERIKARLPQIIQTLPPSVHVAIVGDRTQVIRASVADIEYTLRLTVALVVLVVFVFLRSFWATLIPSIAIPLSIIGTFGVMYLCGYSLDNLSLMGLAIAVGFVVDDAIVMIENIMRRIEGGEAPLVAALNGARQIGFTVISMTVSLVAVFIPLLLMKGVVGRLLQEFAVTVSVAVLVSALVSLTLTPTMCAYFLRAPQAAVHGRVYRLCERAFDAVQRFYARGLQLALTHRAVTLAITFATLGLTLFLYAVIPKGFFPQQDTGLIIGTVDAAEDISYPAMAQKAQALMRIVMQDPDVDNVYGWIGPPLENSGRFMINLKPFGTRHASAAEVIERLRADTAAFGDIQLHMQSRQDVQVGGRISRTQYQYTLEDPDMAELDQWAPRITAELQKLPQLSDVTSDLQVSAPQAVLAIDRDNAARLGVDPQTLDDTLYDALGQRQVATLYSHLSQYHVVLEVSPDFKRDPAALGKIYVPSALGKPIPLSAFTTLHTAVAPLSTSHQDQFPAVTISFNLSAGTALGDAVNAIQRAERRMNKPTALQGNFQGSAQAFRSALASQPYLVAASVITVYIVLGVLYESLIHPITILSTLPSAGLGALVALILCHQEFSLMALVGIVLLIGIVKKNAIMMVDFALESERHAGKTPTEAIYDAAVIRLRPILMTTLAALLGGLPLALGTGAGAELRSPLGIAIVGGLLVSQVMTLYTTPVIYLYLDQLHRRIDRRGREATEMASELR
jgi:multidrug efflux pump